MTELLINYEKSFRKNEDKINQIFHEINLSLSKKKEDSEISNFYQMEELDKLFTEQTTILKQMEIELSTLISQEEYDEYNVKVSSFKKNLDINKKKLNKLKENENLRGDKNISFMSTDFIMKNNGSLNNEKLLYSEHQKLQEVRRVLSSTEDMGQNIMVNMDEQSNSMKKIGGKIKGMNNDLDDSNKVLRKMKQRTKRNKKIIAVLAVILVVVLVTLICVRLTKRKKKM